MGRLLPTVVEFVGFALFVYGLYQVAPALAYVVLGLALVAIGLLLEARRGAPR